MAFRNSPLGWGGSRDFDSSHVIGANKMGPTDIGPDWIPPVLDRLEKVESLLDAMVHQRSIKDWNSTDEVATILGKSKLTVWDDPNRVPILSPVLGTNETRVYASST
jgi:hypothetical protein